jgi:UDP-3-O-[3-hydroxymyristoyl] glucosamine N-acyltransferase LpxD
MDLGEVKKLIDENGYLPKHVSYDAHNVVLGGHYFQTDRPRLWFARVLSLWPEPEKRADIVIHGDDCLFGVNVTIGGVGFGYEYDEQGQLVRIPHQGRVIIGKAVIIHNQVNIDRGVIGDTVIGDGTCIDSLVHIAHNVKIGKHCLIVSGSVFGGSCEIGDYCFIGMNACIKQKVKIGNNVVIGAGAVVTKDVPDNTIYVGNPAKYLKMTEPRDYPCVQ